MITAEIRADQIYENLELILKVLREGSVIAVDNAVKVLALTATQKDEYNKKIFPFLLEHLSTCRPKEVGQHAESTFPAVNTVNREAFIDVLKKREDSLTAAQLARVRKLYKKCLQ